MARTNQAKQSERRTFCRACAHSFDWQNEGYGGKLIMGRCPFREYMVLLDVHGCVEHYKERKDGER